MGSIRVALAALLAIGVLVAAGCGGDDDEAATDTTTTETTTEGAGTTGEVSPILRATVGPGFEIGLTTDDGTAVTSLPAGSYTLLTDDKSDIHNFHLTGAGVDVSTDVSGSGTDSFDIELQEGSYHYQCDPHASSMNGDFEVTG
jgi:plastocyanin